MPTYSSDAFDYALGNRCSQGCSSAGPQELVHYVGGSGLGYSCGLAYDPLEQSSSQNTQGSGNLDRHGCATDSRSSLRRLQRLWMFFWVSLDLCSQTCLESCCTGGRCESLGIRVTRPSLDLGSGWSAALISSKYRTMQSFHMIFCTPAFPLQT